MCSMNGVDLSETTEIRDVVVSALTVYNVLRSLQDYGMPMTIN